MKLKGTIYKPDRYDVRTEAEFKQDIKAGHEIERDIIQTFASIIKKKTGKEAVIVDNGVDNTGDFLYQDKVTMDADYIVNGVLIEVKFIKPQVSSFHFKVAQLDSYIKQGAGVLFVNGYDTYTPTYTVMTPKQLKVIKEKVKPVQCDLWGGKLAYKLQVHWFDWENFLTE